MRNIGSEDGWAFPSSYTMGLTILETLAHSELFHEEVINWARQFKNEMPTPEVRDITRDWWKENGSLILEKKYQAVKPGRDLANPPVITPMVDVPINAAPPSSPSPAFAKPVKPEKPPQRAEETPLATKPEPSFWPAFAILGGFIALLVLGFAARPRQE